jgi:hypothetical protein
MRGSAIEISFILSTALHRSGPTSFFYTHLQRRNWRDDEKRGPQQPPFLQVP